MLILKSLEPHLATWLWVATVQVPYFHLSIILHGAVLIRMVRGTLLLLFGYGKCILAFAESNRSSARGCRHSVFLSYTYATSEQYAAPREEQHSALSSTLR